MNQIESAIQRIIQTWQPESSRPFPYEDIRRLSKDAAEDFRQYAPHSVISADLNEYFSFVAGLASGGVRKYLGDQNQRVRIKKLLEKGFFERYPLYRFLEAIDLTPYPTLRAEMALTDKLRQMLLELLETH